MVLAYQTTSCNAAHIFISVQARFATGHHFTPTRTNKAQLERLCHVFQTHPAPPGLLLNQAPSTAAVMARPRFAYTCKQPQPLHQRHCNTRLTNWQLVEDPRDSPLGIWATHCPECGSFVTVEATNPEANQ